MTTAPKKFLSCPSMETYDFFGMYHYESNAILATPIPGLNNASILATYTKNFEYLTSKGYKPQINVMDN
jgi:hypothetical protein